jgi:hypothetical protein
LLLTGRRPTIVGGSTKHGGPGMGRPSPPGAERSRRFRYPGGKPWDDREVLNGPACAGDRISWEHLPPSLGYGFETTCWRRLRDRNAAGASQQPRALLLTELRGGSHGRFRV